ncbi:MAG: hypothetical protein M1839_005616 [Geoglossum umbratile]|nr:MAG: hypothetical protein M1839_005616 [Geoglossum umbratile]
MEQSSPTKEATQAVIASSLESASLAQVGSSIVDGSLPRTGVISALGTMQEMVADVLRHQESQIQAIQYEYMQHLKEASEWYWRTRRRFLAQFRQRPWDPVHRWFKAMIEKGNKTVYHGDAIMDAKICKERGDDNLTVEVYGLTTGEILFSCCYESSNSMEVLNSRAVLEAGRRSGRPGSRYLDEGYRNAVEDAWRNFLHHLKENLRKSPTANPESPFGMAYRRYWDLYNRKPARS